MSCCRSATDTNEDRWQHSSLPPACASLRGGLLSSLAVQISSDDDLCPSCWRMMLPQATDIYKRLLLESRDIWPNVYVAMCYYKLDYYDVSLEILAVYLQARDARAQAAHRAFLTTVAKRHTRIAAVAVSRESVQPFPSVQRQGGRSRAGGARRPGPRVCVQLDLISAQHGGLPAAGEGGLQVLPQLVDYIPEARLNLVRTRLRIAGARAARRMVHQRTPTRAQTARSHLLSSARPRPRRTRRRRIKVLSDGPVKRRRVHPQGARRRRAGASARV